MIAKIERLIDEATAFLVEARLEIAKKNGAPVQAALSGIEEPPVKKPRKIRAVKEGGPLESPSPFGVPSPSDQITQTLTDQAIEQTRTHCIEVMGAFIRQNLKATPSGLTQAQNICNEVCGRVVPKLDSLTPEENLKLIPVFEAKLKKEGGVL